MDHQPAARMSGPKPGGLLDRVRLAIKTRPRLHRALLPYVQAVRRATRGQAVRNIEKFRAACEVVASRVDAPFFVKVGANDGLTDDPCSDLLLAGGWKGLLIEPVPYCLPRLEANFPDRTRFEIAPVAIGSSGEEAAFYYVDARAKAALPDLPPFFDKVGSFSREHIVRNLGGAIDPFILERRVAVRQLSHLLAERGVGDVHLLHTDAEGFDYEVLKTLDFSRHAPVLLFLEHKHLRDADRSEMLGMLQAKGYSVLNCDGDIFARHDGRYDEIRARAARRSQAG